MKRFNKAMAAIIVMVMLVGSLSGCKKSYRDIVVFDAQGTVSVTRKNKTLDAYKDMVLRSGDSISVSAGGYLRLCLDSNKYVYLNENTVITLIATGDKTNSKTSIYVEQGQMVTEVQEKLNSNSSFEVVTPNTTMAIRGTITDTIVSHVSDGTVNSINEVVEGEVEIVAMHIVNGKLEGQKAPMTKGQSFTYSTPKSETPDTSDIFNEKALKKGKTSFPSGQGEKQKTGNTDITIITNANTSDLADKINGQTGSDSAVSSELDSDTADFLNEINKKSEGALSDRMTESIQEVNNAVNGNDDESKEPVQEAKNDPEVIPDEEPVAEPTPELDSEPEPNYSAEPVQEPQPENNSEPVNAPIIVADNTDGTQNNDVNTEESQGDEINQSQEQPLSEDESLTEDKTSDKTSEDDKVADKPIEERADITIDDPGEQPLDAPTKAPVPEVTSEPVSNEESENSNIIPYIPSNPQGTEQNPVTASPAQQDPTQQDPTQQDPTQQDPTQQDPGQSDPSESQPIVNPDPSQNDPTVPDTFKVFYNIGNATLSNTNLVLESQGIYSETVEFGVEYSDFENYIPELLGFKFKGWYTDPNLSNPASVLYNCASDVNLYPEWEEDTFEVRYHLNGGVLPAGYEVNNDIYSITVRRDMTYQVENSLVVSKAGFYFDGWYIDQNGYSHAPTVIENVDASCSIIDLYAIFLNEKYTIVFCFDFATMDVFDGTQLIHCENNCEVLAFRNQAFNLSNYIPQRTGYDFLGWSRARYSFDGPVTSIDAGVTNDIVYIYAHMNAIKYNINLHFDGAVFTYRDEEYHDFCTIEAFSANDYYFDTIYPVKPGYKFVNWFTTAECITPAASTYAPGHIGDVDCYAGYRGDHDDEVWIYYMDENYEIQVVSGAYIQGMTINDFEYFANLNADFGYKVADVADATRFNKSDRIEGTLEYSYYLDSFKDYLSGHMSVLNYYYDPKESDFTLRKGHVIYVNPQKNASVSFVTCSRSTISGDPAYMIIGITEPVTRTYKLSIDYKYRTSVSENNPGSEYTVTSASITLIPNSDYSTMTVDSTVNMVEFNEFGERPDTNVYYSLGKHTYATNVKIYGIKLIFDDNFVNIGSFTIKLTVPDLQGYEKIICDEGNYSS